MIDQEPVQSGLPRRREAPDLFDRLPEDLFMVLASPRRRQYWNLIVHLYQSRFGPDSGMPPDEGYLHREMSVEIENYLLTTPDWAGEEGEDPATPLTVRANNVLAYLVSKKWLHEEKVGMRRFVTMVPEVQYFIALLLDFVEKGPQFVGGKVQMIYSQLLNVIAHPKANVSGFHAAAREARSLIAMLSATSINVRKVMQYLKNTGSTAEYIETYFREFIQRIFIGDYAELRTSNHPLAYRWQILEIVHSLGADEDKREILVKGYQELLRLAYRDEAERAFDKDLNSFFEFRRIDDYLDRLERHVRSAQEHAISYIRYALRTRGDFERLVQMTIDKVVRDDDAGKAPNMSLAPMLLFSQDLLAEPRNLARADTRTTLRKPELTEHELAMNRLRMAAQRMRYVSKADMRRFLDQCASGRHEFTNDDLAVGSIKDFLCYAALTRHAMAFGLDMRDARDKGYGVDGYHLILVQSERVGNEYAAVPRVILQRARRHV